MNYNQLSRLNWDELAVATATRRNPTSGEAYQRKNGHDGRKQEARNRVLQAFSRTHFPDFINILTFPSLDWSFEKSLIANRESPSHRERPNSTYICAIEKEEAIYRAALKKMPGFVNSCAVLDPAPFASHSVRTYAITRFHRCSFEDLVAGSDKPYTGAWLDFTGTVTVARREVLADFFSRLLTQRLVLTTMSTRYGAATAEAVREHGGDYADWIMAALPALFSKARFGTAARAQDESGKAETGERIVYRYLLLQGAKGANRWEIHQGTGLTYQSVCGRVDGLLKNYREGKAFGVYETGLTRPTTGKSYGKVVYADAVQMPNKPAPGQPTQEDAKP